MDAAGADAEASYPVELRPELNVARVGGQAVLEGVMMRSEHSFAVACRRNDEIVIRESPWKSLWEKHRWLRWPFMRGGVVLGESLANGFSALKFSAEVMEEAERQSGQEGQGSEGTARAESGETSSAATGVVISATFVLSMVFGLALFVGLPHIAAWAMGLRVTHMSFHLVDGLIKMILLLAYLAAIGLMPDIRRVFQYHGGEHKSIATLEAHRPLVVEEARKQSRFHPRCGTSFLFVVVLVSILVFALTLHNQWLSSRWMDNLAKIIVKLPLMFPIAGIAYEILRWSGAHQHLWLGRAVAAPGLWLQRLTTRPTEDEHLDVALASLRKTLWAERRTGVERDRTIEVLRSHRDVPVA